MVAWRIRAKALVGAMLATALVASVGVGASAAGAASGNLLGTKDPAKGEPVKIGFVTDGSNARNESGADEPVAQGVTKWLNEYKGGLGGRPIELVVCTTLAEPSKGTDCANEMIAADVAAVVIPGSSVVQNVWATVNDAGIPVFLYGSTAAELVADTDSTFIVSNGRATNFALPSGLAKENKKKKVSVVAVDIPAATAFFKEAAPALFEEEGLDLELVPVPSTVADMTPQMQQLVANNKDGVVYVLGGDAFCSAAFNGLRAAGFEGTIAGVSFCFTDTTRAAVPGDWLEGMVVGSTAPIDDHTDPVMKQYYKILSKYKVSGVDKFDDKGPDVLAVLSLLNLATKNLKGDPTPEAILASARGMDWEVLPGTGWHVRCTTMADEAQPATCSRATWAAELDASGNPKSYTVVGDTEIPAS